jgi:four helix bundle protein
MSEIQKTKKYDLEERTFMFAKNVRAFVRERSKEIENKDDSSQLIRSSGSVGANYIEANEALGKKDFFMRIKICRKEAKESVYWLRLMNFSDESMKQKLLKEAEELMFIFGSILRKSGF